MLRVRLGTWVVMTTMMMSLGGCTATVDDPDDIETAASALATAPAHHVVLLSGGFGSCSPEGIQGVVPTEASSLLADIRTKSGFEPTVVRTCFGGVGEPNRFEMKISRGYVTLRAGNTTLGVLETELRTLLAAQKPSRFDAYGHSHGGWLVGRVVQDLGPGTVDSFTLNVFFSDPISRTLCTPAVVISGAGRAEYCGRFPLDLSTTTLRANVKGYLGTAFQTEDWLHATPLSGVENIALTPGMPRRIAALNHRALYTLPLTLGIVRSRFEYR